MLLKYVLKKISSISRSQFKKKYQQQKDLLLLHVQSRVKKSSFTFPKTL